MSDVPLREHIEARICALRTEVNARLDAMQVAIDKAESILNLRLEGMNEFRATLKDQAATLATREETARIREQVASLATKEEVEARLRNLELAKAEIEGRTKATAALWGFGAALIVSLIAAMLVKLI